MHGPPYFAYAASALTMRSAPTSRGLSVSTATPVLTPGSTTTGSKWKYRSTISRSAPVTGGTTEEMATPVMFLSKESPCCSRNPPNARASSSAVRSGWVDSRQCQASSWSRNTPTTIWVLPTSTASSMRCPRVFVRSRRPLSRTRREPTALRLQEHVVDEAGLPHARGDQRAGGAFDPVELVECVVVDHDGVVEGGEGFGLDLRSDGVLEAGCVAFAVGQQRPGCAEAARQAGRG